MKNLKTVNGFEYFEFLKDMGVIPLTTESCGLGLRHLCDLTKEGTELISNFLGGGIEISNFPWNRGEHSILITVAMLPDLVIFSLFSRFDAQTVVKFGREKENPNFLALGDIYEDGKRIRQEVKDLMQQLSSTYGMVQYFLNTATSDSPTLRNVHVMSGRIR